MFGIYTLSDLGVSSNPIGSLSWAYAIIHSLWSEKCVKQNGRRKLTGLSFDMASSALFLRQNFDISSQLLLFLTVCLLFSI